MGVYIYSLRAKTVALTMPSGVKVRANLYSYAYRMTSYWKGDVGYNSYRLTEQNTERNAESAFAQPRSGVVIVGDLKDGLEGDRVYTDVTAARWWDTEKFPGTFAGWVAKVGKSYRVTDRTKWSDCTVNGVPMRTRLVMIDGKATYQSVDIGSEADIEREVQELQTGA